MIYALVRGWLAGMAALLVEILLASVFFIPNLFSFQSGTSVVSDIATLPVFFLALLEETMKFGSLLGISHETVPFFRNAIFKGILVGIGFALFEVCIKILFHTSAEENSLLPGTISGALLHISTGGILGTAWFFQEKDRPLILFATLFLLALVLHILYNTILSPILFARFS